jgi:hypothetical protein
MDTSQGFVHVICSLHTFFSTMGLEYTLLFDAGMDAQVAYGFHHLRDEKPFLASGPLSNKVINWGIPFSTFLAVQ